MNGGSAQHLTDAEFSDLLAGELPDEGTRLHLLTCDHCRGELDSVKTSLSSFSGVSTHWAQAVAPARVPAPSRWAMHLWALPSWTTGLAMTALTGLLVFSFGPVDFRAKHRTSAPMAATEPTKTELADDNRLMQSIDQELGYSEQSPVTFPALHARAHASGQSPSTTVLN